MKTPYDTALRMRRYEADRLRIEAARLGAELRGIEDQLVAHDASMTQEAALAGPFDSFDAYAGRMRQSRGELETAKLRMQRALDEIDAGLIAAFTDLKPLELAAENYLANRKARQARQEQAMLDDLAGRQIAYPVA